MISTFKYFQPKIKLKLQIFFFFIFKAKLLIASYNDEMVNVDVEVNITNYKAAVEVCRQWEKSMVSQAQYYDRVFASMHADTKDTSGG